jgi:ribosomal protein S27E
MSVRKGWKIQTPRLQAKCPYCGRKHTVFMTSQANWKIHGVESTLDAVQTEGVKTNEVPGNGHIDSIAGMARKV